MKTALITGITGQDGAYLAQLLLRKGYRVVGARRHGSSGESWRLKYLGIEERVEIVGCDVLEDASVRRVLDHYMPDEVYNLAAQSSIAFGLECPQYTANTNGLGALRFLEGIRAVHAETKFFQASSSEMFGAVTGTQQTEGTPFCPRSPYGTAKLFAHWSTINYRELHGIHASSGIFYNHTSSLQGTEFLASKVIRYFTKCVCNLMPPLEVGDLDARRDWGFAKEYMEAAWMMLQAPAGGSYIVATGVTLSVRELIGMAARCAGIELDWMGQGEHEIGFDQRTGRHLVSVNPKFCRPAERGVLCGNPAALRVLGWSPKLRGRDLVGYLMEDTRSCHGTEAPCKP